MFNRLFPDKVELKEMNHKEYWLAYLEMIPKFSYESFYTEEQITENIVLPESLSRLSKMNSHNAQLLLAVSISKLFSLKNIFENVSIELVNQYIPLPDCNEQILSDAAKNVLTNFRQHLNNLPAIEFQPSLINFYQHEANRKSLINFKIDESLSKLQVLMPSNFKTFVNLLFKETFDLLETIGTNKGISFSDTLLKEFNGISRNKLPEIVEKCWPEIHDFPLKPELSYLENGGDSIQAIRLLSRLQRDGYFSDLSSLINSKSILDWKIEYRGVSNLLPDSNLRTYPLSATQKLIWEDWSSLNQLHIYHEQFLFKLDKCPTYEVIKSAYEYIWQKYPQLRVNIDYEENGFIQIVQESKADFRIIKGKGIDEILQADLSEPFGKILMRCTFIDLDKDKYILWSHHHVLLDGWSVGKLIAEFIEIIERGIPKLTISPNYQQILLGKENLIANENETAYWESFFNNRSALALPKKSAEKGEYETFIAKLDNIENFRSASEKAAVSLQSYLLTHFFLTVFSINGKNNTYLHSISSGRSLIPEYAEEAVGLFIRNIIPGFEIKEDDTILSLLQNFHKDFIKTVEMEFTSPELINSYQEERPDVLFVFENYPYQTIKGDKISGELIDNHELTGYPFSFLIMPQDDCLNIKIIYDSGRFSSEFISTFYHKFSSLLLHFKANLNDKVYQLEDSLNKLSIINDKFPFWYDEIIRKTSKSKNQISSSRSEEKIAFNKIENLAASFSNYFKDLQKGNRIAVFGEKNEKLPAIAYSIMRNGFVYLPINISWPLDRISKTLKLAECSHIIITDDSPSLELPDYLTIHKDVFSIESDISINYRPELDDEAYLLFTSGSSGMPKGVSLSHKNLSSFLDACTEYCDPNNYELIFSFTNIGFDLSIFENLYGLYSDKSIHVIHKPIHLWEELQKFNGILLNTVPSVIINLKREEIKNISVLHTAGEPFRNSAWELLKEGNPNIKIFNWYGPTETTTYSTCVDLSDAYSASIGKALKHELIFITDALGLKQMDGLDGEIIIGGEGVGRYLINENEKFLCKLELNFYRTGDRALRKNGQIYLRGREDRQVKRLGQRFELSEIELWIIANYNQIKRVYYYKSKDEQFLLFLETEVLKEAEIKTALSNQFPDYMLPELIKIMPSFPENDNGKMDIGQMLKSIDKIDNAAKSDSKLLASLKQKDGLFKSLNGNLSFTSQGGDSILGLRIISKLKKMGYRIEISDLLNAESLNECFSKLRIEEITTSSITEDLVLLSPIQKWFKEDYKGNLNHFNQSVLLELFIPLSTEEIFTKVKICFNSIDLLKRSFNSKWEEAQSPIFQIINIQDHTDITAHCEILQRSFNLIDGPVAAIAIFKSPNSVFLFISIHHFYCDGITWRILMDRLQDSLTGIESSQTDIQVFGRVQAACRDFGQLDEKDNYYPNIISNPFQNLQVCSYKQSEFRNIEWNANRSNHFLKNWNKEHTVNEKFVSFFLHSWLRAKQPKTAIFLETHGRQYSGIPEITESIGWFTQFYMLSENDYPSQKNEINHYVKQSFSKLPNNGLGYMGMSNWQTPPFPILLNFLGSFDENWNSMARPVNFDESNQVDPDNPMLAFVEINGIILEGKIRWMFRTHPEVPIDLFVAEWEKSAIDLLSSDSDIYSNENIDKDDIDKISQILNIPDL